MCTAVTNNSEDVLIQQYQNDETDADKNKDYHDSENSGREQ